MKQIIQSLSNGKLSLVDVPMPNIKKGMVLIQSKFSVISSGTERMLLEFGKANYLNKVRQQPEKVKIVLLPVTHFLDRTFQGKVAILRLSK